MSNEKESIKPLEDQWELLLIPKNEKIIIYILKLNSYEIFGEEFTIELLHKNRLLLSSRTIQEIFDFIYSLNKNNQILIKETKQNLSFILKSTFETIPDVELTLIKKNTNSEEVINLLINELLKIKNEKKEGKDYEKEISNLKEEISFLKKKVEEIEKKLDENKNIKEKIQLETCNLTLLNIISNSHSKIITSIQVFPCGNFISVSKDRSIKIYDYNNFNQLQIINNAHNKGIAYVSIKDDFNFITSSADCDIKIWIKKENSFFEFEKIEHAHSANVGKIIYCQNGNIISCSKDGMIKIWEKKTNKYENIYFFDEKINCNNYLFSILFIQSKNLLIASGDERTIILNLTNKELYQSYENVVCETWNALDKINDDKIIVGGGNDKIIKIITISNHSIEDIPIDFECYGICSFEEKGIFLICGKSKDISVYRSDNYSNILTFKKAHNGMIVGLQKMNNGLIISYSGEEKDNSNANIKIWILKN